jgi:fluoroquinolone transport system permease protein
VSRLASAVRWDAVIQFRNGFYYAALFVTLVWIFLLRQVPLEYRLLLLPAMLAGNLLINAFYFVAGLVLLEKAEGSLQAQVVTPLRRGEYLASKALTLGLLSLAEGLAITLLGHGLAFNPLLLALGLLSGAGLLALLGFVAIARYDSINEYLMPSIGYMSALILPFIDYFQVWQSPLFYLHPLQAPLIVLRAAFQPIAPLELLFGLLASALWIAAAFAWSQRVFYHFIILRPGQ